MSSRPAAGLILHLLGDAFAAVTSSNTRPKCAQHLLAACNVWHALQRASLKVFGALLLLLVVRWLQQLFVCASPLQQTRPLTALALAAA